MNVRKLSIDSGVRPGKDGRFIVLHEIGGLSKLQAEIVREALEGCAIELITESAKGADLRVDIVKTQVQ